MPFSIIRQDITLMSVDAIVNAANTRLAAGGGVCGAIFSAAGFEELQAACSKLSPIKTGEAVITPGFKLKAKHVIHAAGPIYDPSDLLLSKRLLESAYTQSLNIAKENGCESIAFPLISSGIYGYPKAQALEVAIAAIKAFLSENDMDIYLTVFDKSALKVSEKLLGAVESYISQNYVDEHTFERSQRIEAIYASEFATAQKSAVPTAAELDSIIGNLDESFSASLLRLIDAKGRTDTEVYKRANIDRKLFSKIRTGKGYMPSKRTALALAVALELTRDETNALLEKAGYALSHSQKFDVIIEYFIMNGQYDIFEINEILFKYDQPLLGGG